MGRPGLGRRSPAGTADVCDGHLVGRERGVLFRRGDLPALSFSSLFFVLGGSSSSRCIELDHSGFAGGVCVDDAGVVSDRWGSRRTGWHVAQHPRADSVRSPRVQ